MVPRTHGKQITVFSGLIIVIIFAYYLFDQQIQKGPVYSANSDSLNMAVLDGIVAANISNSSEIDTKAIIVPHHLVTSKSIALGVKALASSTPPTVVIISPDHFENCPKLVCTTKGSYQTFFGDVFIANKEVDQLTKSKLVGISELFTEEHGIYSIVPFVKYYIPNAKIIPIVISQKSKGTEADRSEIIKLLKSILIQGSALIISSDFSHYLVLKEADKMDEKTQNSFCSGNDQEILNLKNPSQSDCPLCLWILEQEAKQLGFWNPILVSHTNSAKLLNNSEVKETTSHFTYILSTESTGNCPISN